ncbi:flagellar protein FliS [bacterium]|nr:flagellar protein FliS [bacterium]
MRERRSVGRAYQEVQVKTSTVGRAVLMLFDSAIRFSALTKKQMMAQNVPEAYKSRGKLLCVLSGLMSSLDIESGHKEVESFFFLYSYASRLARETDVKMQNASNLNEITRIMSELRRNWKAMLLENPAL